jgi:hypothetical protein
MNRFAIITAATLALAGCGPAPERQAYLNDLHGLMPPPPTTEYRTQLHAAVSPWEWTPEEKAGRQKKADDEWHAWVAEQIAKAKKEGAMRVAAHDVEAERQRVASGYYTPEATERRHTGEAMARRESRCRSEAEAGSGGSYAVENNIYWACATGQ